MNKGIAVAGATGEVGKRLIDNLIARNQNTVIYAFVRQHSSFLPESVQQHVVDFKNLNDLELSLPIDMAYCCLGSTIKQAGSQGAFKQVDHDFILNFANWCKRQQCEKFACISAVGANGNSSNFYLRVKGETERSLANLGFTHLWILRPSLLLGSRREFRLAEYCSTIISRFISPFLLGPLTKYKPIQMMVLADTMAKLNEQQDIKEGCVTLEGTDLYSESD